MVLLRWDTAGKGLRRDACPPSAGGIARQPVRAAHQQAQVALDQVGPDQKGQTAKEIQHSASASAPQRAQGGGRCRRQEIALDPYLAPLDQCLNRLARSRRVVPVGTEHHTAVPVDDVDGIRHAAISTMRRAVEIVDQYQPTFAVFVLEAPRRFLLFLEIAVARDRGPGMGLAHIEHRRSDTGKILRQPPHDPAPTLEQRAGDRTHLEDKEIAFDI